MNATMSAYELTSHVEQKFSGAYRVKATMVKWDTEAETATFMLAFIRGYVVYPELACTIYAQAWQADGNPTCQGAATSSYPFTAKQAAPYYVEVM